MRRIRLTLSVAAALPLAAIVLAPAATARLARVERLSIATDRGEVRFEVEVARTPAEQARGLMFRDRLPAGRGMIFPFDPPQPATFWMKNTRIPLDMLCVRADGVIARVAPMATPYSLAPIECGERVAAVVEIAGGRAAATGIRQGGRVRWGALGR